MRFGGLQEGTSTFCMWEGGEFLLVRDGLWQVAISKDDHTPNYPSACFSYNLMLMILHHQAEVSFLALL